MDGRDRKFAIWWGIVLVVLSCLDAFRDVLRGQVGWWWWHIVKWLQFYPLLIYIWATKLGRWGGGWGLWRLVVVVASLIVWNVVAFFWRPSHWGEWTAPFWLRWVF